MNLNTSQVQLTNDASTVSKCSAVSKGYFKDDFIGEFVEKKKSRASLIHLGYWTRAVIINKLITHFIEFINLQKCPKFQIISCGSGFDTTYWRLSEGNLLNRSIFVEIDFSDVIQRKIFLINHSEKLNSYVNQYESSEDTPNIHRMNYNYYLLEADLSDLELIEKLFGQINIDYSIPTLFLSECVITYMKEFDSSKLIEWMGKKFENSAFINYEQIHPEDGFGGVMLKHFDKLQSSLFSVVQYPDCESHYSRYKNLGFESRFCVSEWDALVLLTSKEERRQVLSLELFDEFEEFHLKCSHYVVAIAGNGISSNWISRFVLVRNSMCDKLQRDVLEACTLSCNLELFRHSCCGMNGSSFVFGGCSKENRSTKVYKITHGKFLDVTEIKISENSNIHTDMVYGSAVGFEMNKVPFFCLYGGRRSPNRISNDGSLVLFEFAENELLPILVLNKENVIPRYRTAMACLKFNEREVHCWIFGGRTIDLNQSLSDFWELSINCDDEENITVNWKPHEKKNENWPCSRMSHSFLACPKRFQLFLIGGLVVDSSSVLNDMWKWCCRSESWEQVQLAGILLPRYGHTAHLKDDMIYLVGGVNTLSGRQPELGVIDLKNLTVTEFEIQPRGPEPVLLFNHSSELVGHGDDARIAILGGGGNCFSFGTHLNQGALFIPLKQLNDQS